MIVEAGGAVNFGEHLWIGFNAGGVGTLELNGGTVNVTGMFGLGWNGGVGYAHINDGTLNLNGFDSTQSIRGESVMNIESVQLSLMAIMKRPWMIMLLPEE